MIFVIVIMQWCSFFFSSLDEFDEYKIKSLTYSAIAAIPNDELKGIKKVKLCINLSDRIF